jgi:ribosomal protein S18 acetylase RimI-like enzyme
VPSWPDGCHLAPFVLDQDERRVYDFVTEAFRWPGFVPPSFDQWRERMIETGTFREDLWFLLVDRAGNLVATALCCEYEIYGWVRNLAVAEAWRNRGIGSALLQAVFGEFYRRGQPRIALGVDGNNPDAYRFYERLGMTQVRQFVLYNKQIAR